MNFKVITALCITSVLFCQSGLAAQNSLTFKNQRGSTLELNFLPDNKIEGSFTTAVGSKSCPQAVNKKRPITGYVVGNAITFTVVYPLCDSLVSVTGNFSQNQKTIDTIFIVNAQANNSTQENFDARYIGHDVYTKTS